jgi:amino acid permease
LSEATLISKLLKGFVGTGILFMAKAFFNGGELY